VNKLFNFIVTGLFGLYVVKLVILGQLIFYINPKYTGFALFTGLICALVGIIGIIVTFRYGRRLSLSRPTFKPALLSLSQLGSLALIMTLLIALLMPPKPLNATGSISQIKPENTVSKAADKMALIIKVIGNDPSKYGFSDWYTIAINSPDFSFQNGKPIDIIGLVFKSNDYPNGTFGLGRYIVYCCAIDARPFGFLVQAPVNQVTQNQWYEVKGHFVVEKIGGEDQLKIIPDQIIPATQPDNPYL
jgi:putative membrane protein